MFRPARKSPTGDADPVTPADLRRRAIAHLARREHSRAELAARLTRNGGDATEVDAVVAALAEEGLLSDQRFAESLARSRSQRYGSTRIAGELRSRGVATGDTDLLEILRESDAERAKALWQRKYGIPADDIAGRSKQMRFLQARGFPSDVIRRVVPPVASRERP